jgi:L-ribulose-5-phosphate 3-epimerase
MKISGHTLGTPGMTLPDAIMLFQSAGLDAAEIIWQDDYPAAIPEDASDSHINHVKQLLEDSNLTPVCLTPYMTDINSLDIKIREKEISRFAKCIHAAHLLNCPNIRVYAGRWIPGDEDKEAKYEKLVLSLQHLGKQAHQARVILCIENHFNTMTVSAKETAELIADVNSPGIAVLYDQANLTFTYNEQFKEAIDLQKGRIQHVHAKDLIFVDPNQPFKASAVAQVSQEERSIRSRVIGEGVLDWPAILTYLIQTANYDGSLSLEYEYRWHPDDLPPPEVGLKKGAEALRKILENIEKEGV